MPERNLELEMDELKKELSEIKELLKSGGKQSSSNTQKKYEVEEGAESVGHIRKMSKTSKTFASKPPEITAILDKAENIAGIEENTGRITYAGVFSSGGCQSTWVSENVNTDSLLKLIEIGTAEKVLNCVGNNDRLNILLAILKKPMTVAELVAHGGYNSTGQVYHHLKPLITADLVKEEKEDKNLPKGTYTVQPHKVQGIIMLLAGISDMIDEKYTKGDWEQALAETEE
jgi:DNA-binding transcriptional regulator GbsR (MarR family)